MKLLQEEIQEIKYLYEGSNVEGKKNLYVEGIFLQSNIKNRNGRIYPKAVMDKAVTHYMKESIERKNSFGELNHPTSPTINLDRVSHLIVDLKEDGDNYIGKAKILDTPMGLIARSLIEGGGQLAISSRGTGSVKKIGGAMQVQEDLRFSTAGDLVSNPSAPQAYLEAILEAPDWFFDQVKQEWLMNEALDDLHSQTTQKLDEEVVFNAVEKVITSLRVRY